MLRGCCPHEIGVQNRSACVRLPEHLTTSNLGKRRAFDTVKGFLFGSVEFGTISASTGTFAEDLLHMIQKDFVSCIFGHKEARYGLGRSGMGGAGGWTTSAAGCGIGEAV